MTDVAKKVFDRILDAIHNNVKSLNKIDYRDIMEELSSHADGCVEAVNDELAEDE